MLNHIGERTYVLPDGTIQNIWPITADEHVAMLAGGARDITRGTTGGDAVPTMLQEPAHGDQTPLLMPVMNFAPGDNGRQGGPTATLTANTPRGNAPQHNAAAHGLGGEAPLLLPVMPF
jgi:hypothetical protein